MPALWGHAFHRCDVLERRLGTAGSDNTDQAVLRAQLYPLDQAAYRLRNVIERIFCRPKDFRRIATRYDKLARNFLAAVALVAAVIWWAD